MRIKGTGPTPASVMLVGEAPGREEDLRGLPFIGKSGQELTRYLTSAGINRASCYVTNLVKERPPVTNGKQKPPSRQDIQRDEGELLDELVKVRPHWIGAIGRYSARWFLGPVDMESAHGLAFPIPDVEAFFARLVARLLVDGGSGAGADSTGEETDALQWLRALRVVPIYHPAAALHNPEVAPLVQWDINQFSGYVRGTLLDVVPHDTHRQRERYHRGDARALEGFVGPTAVDTEGLAGSPWGLSASQDSGSACVVSHPQPGVGQLHASQLIFHHALHDVPILREMGFDVDWSKVDDTYLMAYCLRVVPMGLKALARRFCGMEMQSYLDVVAPAEKRLALEWVEKALEAKRCDLCGGTGKVLLVNKASLKRGELKFKKEMSKCTMPGCSFGGLWPQRDPHMHYDWKSGLWRELSGWTTGHYLKRLKEDLDSGHFEETSEEDEEGEDGGQSTTVRGRVEGWPDDVVCAINRAVGELSEPTLDDLPEEVATSYSARDADATLRIYPILKRQIEELELTEAYKLDLSVLPIASEMMRTGMRVDVAYFEKFTRELEEENGSCLDELRSIVGRPLNPVSGDQVAGLLFGQRGLTYTDQDRREFEGVGGYDLLPEKLTRSGRRGATDDKVLEGLKLKHAANPQLVQILNLILDYRTRDKLIGTYTRKLPLMIDKESRIHTQIKPCRTATFRWASANPNLQNIPTRAKGGRDLGKRVRMGFVASPGYVMGSWDFDQIEMRVLAYYSQDETLLEVFRRGLDIHAMTASKVFRVPIEQVTPDQRTSAKNIGFGIVYGVTARGLQAQMELRGQNWTVDECQELINAYLYSAYPGVGRFMLDAHAEARSTGLVRSLFGHVRYMPNVHSSIASIKEEALRQAANFKIQCTAAELLKVAMRDLWLEGRDLVEEVGARWLMAVHDELLFEVRDNQRSRTILDNLVSAYMTNPAKLEGVHVGTTGKYASNWGELK